jgi:hypothetical protein
MTDEALPVGAVPVTDTTDLRSGPPLHDRLLALLPLVGVWTGHGTGAVAHVGSEFSFAQHVTFSHDGRPFLYYESRSWLVDAAGDLIRLAWRESGFWRPGADPDALEAVVAANTGQSLVFAGRSGDLRWELETTSAEPAATAIRVGGERRLYAVTGNELSYATELAPGGRDFSPHLNASLRRIDSAGTATPLTP